MKGIVILVISPIPIKFFFAFFSSQMVILAHLAPFGSKSYPLFCWPWPWLQQRGRGNHSRSLEENLSLGRFSFFLSPLLLAPCFAFSSSILPLPLGIWRNGIWSWSLTLLHQYIHRTQQRLNSQAMIPTRKLILPGCKLQVVLIVNWKAVSQKTKRKLIREEEEWEQIRDISLTLLSKASCIPWLGWKDIS